MHRHDEATGDPGGAQRTRIALDPAFAFLLNQKRSRQCAVHGEGECPAAAVTGADVSRPPAP